MVSRKIVALVLNALVMLFVVYSSVRVCMIEGLSFARSYTHLSNLFAGLMSAAYVAMRLLKGKNHMASRTFSLLRYCAAACLFLTFVVVVFVLAPEKGGWNGYREMLFGPVSFFTHLATPLLFILSFVCFEGDADGLKTWWSVVPTVFYAVVMIPLNIAKITYGPYFFLKVRERPVHMTLVWVVVILFVDYVLGWLLLFLRKRLNHEGR